MSGRNNNNNNNNNKRTNSLPSIDGRNSKKQRRVSKLLFPPIDVANNEIVEIIPQPFFQEFPQPVVEVILPQLSQGNQQPIIEDGYETPEEGITMPLNITYAPRRRF